LVGYDIWLLGYGVYLAGDEVSVAANLSLLKAEICSVGFGGIVKLVLQIICQLDSDFDNTF
jgi:hypothetical protein